MCVSLAPAHFSGTMICLGAAIHPFTRRPVHTLIYQNTAQNLSAGPNAMLLHFPASDMTRDNLVDTRPFCGFTQDIMRAVNPQPVLRGRSIPKGAVEVFDYDIYTVVLAKEAGLIPRALHLVPPDRRPPLSDSLFSFYGKCYQDRGWSFALLCFNNRDAQKAAPIMWWYEPLDPSVLMLPSLDAHTGEAPQIYEPVEVDHWIIIGTQERRGVEFKPVDYLSTHGVNEPLAVALLPKYVAGKHFTGMMPNGDFIGSTHAFDHGPRLLKRGML